MNRALLLIKAKGMPIREVSLVTYSISNDGLEFMFYDYVVDSTIRPYFEHLWSTGLIAKARLRFYGPGAPGYGDDGKAVSIAKFSFNVIIRSMSTVKHVHYIDSRGPIDQITVQGRIV